MMLPATASDFDQCRIGFQLCSTGEQLWRVAIGIDHVKDPKAWERARAKYDQHVEACGKGIE